MLQVDGGIRAVLGCRCPRPQRGGAAGPVHPRVVLRPTSPAGRAIASTRLTKLHDPTRMALPPVGVAGVAAPAVVVRAVPAAESAQQLSSARIGRQFVDERPIGTVGRLVLAHLLLLSSLRPAAGDIRPSAGIGMVLPPRRPRWCAGWVTLHVEFKQKILRHLIAGSTVRRSERDRPRHRGSHYSSRRNSS